MYIVLVSSTGRKGPLAQGIEAQILGLYMAHFLGLVSLIVCVRACLCVWDLRACAYGDCVFVQRFCVCTRCVRVHYGDYQTMFLCLYPLRESLEVIQILNDPLVLALSVVQECCLLRHVDSRAKAPRGLDFAPHRHACESSICPRFLARIRGPLRSSLFAGPFFAA